MILQEEIERLISAARECRMRAYAPYSNYQVGAALLCGSGRIYPGCNVENASYGLTICAERSAIVSAVSGGENDFRAIAVVTRGEESASPCGACRQFLVEFNPAMEVILAGSEGSGRKMLKACELLPGFFGPKALGQDPENR